MLKLLRRLNLLLFLSCLCPAAFAQSDQVVVSGSTTIAVSFPSTCTYNWTNSAPGIGLPGGGTGDIGSFTATNKGTVPVIATITCTPLSTSFAYIANWTSGNVSVVNTTTNAVTATIPVGSKPFGVSVSHDNTRVFVANIASNTVSVISTANNKVTATIPVGNSPYSLCLSPDDSRLYVINNQSQTLSVINTATNGLIVTVPLSTSPYALAISPDGKWVYIGHNIMANSIVTVVNTATNKVTATIPVAVGPEGLAVSPDGNSLYVSNVGSNSLTIINTQTNKVAKVIPTGQTPEGVAVSPDGSRVYTANFNSNSVTVINTTTGLVTAAVPVGSGPTGISISPDGLYVIVTNDNDNTVSIINAATDQVTNTVNTGDYPDAQGNFITAAVTCSPVTFNITVNPAPIQLPTITAGPITGQISGCVGSASPDRQQFTVSGLNLSGAIAATVPPDFELSLSAGGPYAAALTIPQAGGVVYVRSAASDAVGNIAGQVTLSSPGAADQKVAVAGAVNALPVVNPVADQVVTGGSTTTAINFSGTGNAFTWTNDTPLIGLPASGSGAIPAFIAVNNGPTAITATITVTSVNKQAGFEYMTDNTANQVSVISNLTNSIIATINTGAGPYGIAMSPDGSRAYVTNFNGGTVSVINTTTNKVEATVTVGDSATGIAVSPDGGMVYVCCQNGLAVINTTTNKLVNSLLLSNYVPVGLTVSPDGKWVYVADPNNNDLIIINTSTYRQTKVYFNTSFEDSSINVATSPDGSLIYVTGANSKLIFVINAATQTLISPIHVPETSIGIAVSPDGSRIYVTNEFSNSVSVINAASGAVISTLPVGYAPEGISVSPDGSTIYVANIGDNTMSVIDASTNLVTAVIPAGSNPHALGNFILPATSCSGPPVTLTIKVNPATATITASAASGKITACQGTASASPAIQQFTVSGNHLTADVFAVAPAGFEISANPDSGYGPDLNISSTAGTVSTTILYVRSAASATTGKISGNIILNSAGAIGQNVAVSATVAELPAVDVPHNQAVPEGNPTTLVHFTGSAATYTWVNDNPAIGLAASGNGDILSFTGLNNTAQTITAEITVIPMGSLGCSGTPVIFTITVGPLLTPKIISSSNVTALKTVYGTPSPAGGFTVSEANTSADITVTSPAGFEVSTDNLNFSHSLVITTGMVFIRLSATTPVGDYTNHVVLSATAATEVDVTVTGIVSPAQLTITAAPVSKVYGVVLTGGPGSSAFNVKGLQNGETIGSVTLNYGPGAAEMDPADLYSGSVTASAPAGGNFSTGNYTITYVAGDLDVTRALLYLTADNKKKTLNTPNPELTATYNGLVGTDRPADLVPQPVLSTTAGLNSPPGKYPISLKVFTVANYEIIPASGTLTILSDVTVPNTFTPNGDGINDTWEIDALSYYTACTVNIFNRFGTLLYHAVGYAVPWNGTYQNKPLPSGTYYYLINLGDGSAPMAGPVTIIR